MSKRSIKVKCSFEITRNTITKTIPCMVDIKENNKSYIENLNDFSLCNGILEIDGDNISNAVIYFMQPQNSLGNTIDYDTNHYTDGINGVKNWHWNNTFEMHTNNIIKDKVITDKSGKYTSYINNGIYDIKIEYNGKTESIKNQDITDGLSEEYYYIVKGDIKKKLKSTYIMVDDFARNIELKYINQYGNLINGEIVISKDNDLIVYRKIYEDGSMFALEPDIYDIRLKADNINTIIIRNFEFDEQDDFIDKLINYLLNNDIIYVTEEEQEEEKPNVVNDETYLEN